MKRASDFRPLAWVEWSPPLATHLGHRKSLGHYTTGRWAAAEQPTLGDFFLAIGCEMVWLHGGLPSDAAEKSPADNGQG